MNRGSGCQVRVVQWWTWSESRAFYVLADLRLSLTQLQRTANTFRFLFFSLAFCTSLFSDSFVPPPSSFILCLSLILSVSFSVLRTTFLCSHSLNFSCVDFSHCLLLFFPLLCLFLPLIFMSVMLDVSCCQLLQVSPLICPVLLMS